MIDQLTEEAKLDVTLYLRESVSAVLTEWAHPPRERKALGLFMEFNFPFLNLQVQKILNERNPHSEAASDWLKNNPRYPIDAYLLAENIGWISCGQQHILSSLFPLTEMAEWYFLKDLKWFSKLLIAVNDAIEKQIIIDPKASMAKRIQTWCLERDKSSKRASRWLEGTSEGEANLARIENYNSNPTTRNPKRLPEVAGQENARRREKFAKWVPCWQAELQGLDVEIELRSCVKTSKS